MNLYFRFLILLIRSVFYKGKQDLFSECETPFRVNLLDLDLNFHMNNGRYLSLMDLGRTDLMIKSQVFKKLFGQGYYPVVVSESIRFKKSLELFQKFTIVTQVDSWDEKDFYIRQEFRTLNPSSTEGHLEIRQESEVVAVGFIRGRFKQRGRKGSVPTSEIFTKSGYPDQQKPKTPLAQCQDAIDDELIPRSR